MSSPIQKTTFIEPDRLNQVLGTQLTLVAETFQPTGSFKIRGAYNLANSVRNNHIITASSGNFGHALAYACQILSKRCTVIMPDTTTEVKVQAVKSYAGEVRVIDTKVTTRGQAVHDLGQEFPDAYIANSYDDILVIQGNASLGHELAQRNPRPDCVIIPIGGGGLSAGIIYGFRQAGAIVKVIGAEPSLANDAAESLRTGTLQVHDHESNTIADGARTPSLGTLNWDIIQNGMDQVIEVPEEEIRRAVKFAFGYANLIVEPTGALALAAILIRPSLFAGQHVYCVISGGNVDKRTFEQIIKN